MKKKIMLAIFAITLSTMTIVGLISFVSQAENEFVEEDGVYSHTTCKGKHCSYSVGCDCSGFSAKTNGKEWEKSYCKRCGHHKKYHR